MPLCMRLTWNIIREGARNFHVAAQIECADARDVGKMIVAAVDRMKNALPEWEGSHIHIICAESQSALNLAITS